MKFLVFAIVYPLVWLISILPFRILYFISDLFFFIIYYIIGYRKKVVYENLKTAFPKKSDLEIKKLTKKSIHHFTDFIFESIKTFTISEKAIKKRFKYNNLQLLKEIENQNRGIVLTGFHYANWEWIIYLAKHISLEPLVAYTRISNPYFEKIVKSSREKFGARFIKNSDFKKELEKAHKTGKNVILGLLSDQSPIFQKAKYWTNFFNKKVPVYVGAEELAKKYNLTVVNFKTNRVKRGYYEIDFEIITKKPNNFKNYQITQKYLKIAEKHIKKQPEFYLWTHKRFKHANRYNEWKDTHKRE